MAATFESVASTREDYIATIEGIKAAGPSNDVKSSGKHTKVEQNHLALVKALEDRIEAIDHEINVSLFWPFTPSFCLRGPVTLI